MSAEPNIDPRGRSLYPTQEEIDAWATREHARRAAWVAGPGEDEKLDWARRYRWRATLGLEESRLGPSRDDIDRWAESEHKRRAAWLAGPTAAERQSWARQQQQRVREVDAPLPSSDEEVAAWATKEKQRRQEWAAGPTDEEKREWAEAQGHGVFDDLMSLPEMMMRSDFAETAQGFMRDAELAGKGTVYALSRAPLRLWSYFVRTGRAFEEELYQQPRRRRVRY
ncbi:MAG: hypothetical protein HY270_03570 [Deltaproteobacteria bacterium]|nr:hypothetical protein [Deltaproteobacteria bacterium]